MPRPPYGDDDSLFVLQALLMNGGNRERIRRVMARLQRTSSRDENGKMRNTTNGSNGSTDAAGKQVHMHPTAGAADSCIRNSTVSSDTRE
jgi:hypothetical protein